MKTELKTSVKDSNKSKKHNNLYENFKKKNYLKNLLCENMHTQKINVFFFFLNLFNG